MVAVSPIVTIEHFMKEHYQYYQLLVLIEGAVADAYNCQYKRQMIQGRGLCFIKPSGLALQKIYVKNPALAVDKELIYLAF